MKKRFWILGASDPEMEAVEGLLKKVGEPFALASVGGVRANPASAYKAEAEIPPGTEEICLVECRLAETPAGMRVVVIDHHRPGDPGYGLPPAQYWQAASVGQAWRLLRGSEEPPEELRLVAAADHCLAAAYRGECPGVDPDALMKWRIQSRAAFQKRPEEEILADVENARRKLREAPELILAPGVAVRDLRHIHVPELPEASARENLCFVSRPIAKDGTQKIVCQSGSPMQIRAFMEWAQLQPGLRDIYGDPARGFAGATEAPPAK